VQREHECGWPNGTNTQKLLYKQNNSAPNQANSCIAQEKLYKKSFHLVTENLELKLASFPSVNYLLLLPSLSPWLSRQENLSLVLHNQDACSSTKFSLSQFKFPSFLSSLSCSTPFSQNFQDSKWLFTWLLIGAHPTDSPFHWGATQLFVIRANVHVPLEWANQLPQVCISQRGRLLQF